MSEYQYLFNETSVNASLYQFNQDAKTNDVLCSEDDQGTFIWRPLSTLGLVTSILGTADQVLANGSSTVAQTGNVVLSLPQSLATTSSPTFNVLSAAQVIAAIGDFTTLNSTTGNITTVNSTNTNSTNAALTNITSSSIVMSGGIIPDVTNSHSLGNGVRIWDNIFVKNIIATGNASLSTTNSTAKFAVYNSAVDAIFKVDTTNSRVETQDLIPRAANYQLGSYNNSWYITWSEIYQSFAGGASVPSYSWKLDNSTGLYNPAASTIGISTAGVKRITIDTAALITNVNILPEVDNVTNLGSSSKTYANIYANNIVTGSLSTGNIIPALNSTYTLGTNLLRWLNVYADTITATNIGGSLTTPVQTAITSVGILTGLQVNGSVGINTAPSTTLHVKGTTTTNCLLFLEPSAWAGGSYSTIQFGDTNHYIKGEYGVGVTVYSADAIKFDGNNVSCRSVLPLNNNTWNVGGVGNVFANIYATNLYGSHTGDIVLPDGSAGTPSLRFTNSLNMGLYRISNNRLGLSCNSTNVFDIQTSLTTISSNLVVTSRLGIDDTTNSTRFGYISGSLTAGTQNTFLGYAAGNSLTGNTNTILGAVAAYSLNGADNIAVGNLAMYDLRFANRCISIGKNSMRSAASSYADDCIAIGDGSLYNILGSSGTHVSNLIGIGTSAFSAATTAFNSVAIGYSAGSQNKSGNNNYFIGYECGRGTGATNASSSNTAIGLRALYSITTNGDYNVAFGNLAGYSITTGSHNICIGSNAGNGTTTSVGNISIGQAALYTSSTASWCIAIGYESFRNTTNSDNTGVGARSGSQITSGGQNSAFGSHSLYNATTSNYCTAIGYNALYGSLTAGVNSASSCTAVGYQCLYSFKSGAEQNTAVGFRAGYNITTGDRNCAFGNEALYSQTTPTGNCAFGNSSLRANVTGTGLTAFGYQAGYANTANGNSFFGWNAAIALTTGDSNCLFGYQVGYASTTATNNCYFGYEAAKNLTTGSTNIAIGTQALFGNTGANAASNNIAIGYQTLYTVNSTAADNIAIGTWNSKLLTTGGQNTSMGVNALTACTTGSRNVAIGYESSISLTTLSDNVAVGHQSCKLLTSGSYCTAVGNQALATLTSNSYCTAMGYYSLQLATGEKNTAYGSYSGNNTTTGDNNVFIGYNARNDTAARSDCIVIGTNTVNRLALDGTITIGFGGVTYNHCFIDGIFAQYCDPGTAQQIYCDFDGRIGTAPSIEAMKQNIHDMGDYSQKIHDLRPVLFNMRQGDTERQHWGLIAEEVEKVFPELARYDKEGKLNTVAYHELASMMLNEIQKLKKSELEYKKRVHDLESIVLNLDERLSAIEVR